MRYSIRWALCTDLQKNLLAFYSVDSSVYQLTRDLREMWREKNERRYGGDPEKIEGAARHETCEKRCSSHGLNGFVLN